jgi:predicted SprT family Zn-dependent metalloprotease
MHPTTELYTSLQTAYEHFNETLFDNKLEKVIFTVQRQKGVMGYFAPERWGNLNGKKCHEIAINPSYIANARLIEVMQTLVHEMVHCWQHCFGSPGRAYYHNKEWAYKMIDIGLMPSSTGEPNGSITGQHMGDYIIEGGKFLENFNYLFSQKKFQLKWIDRKSLPRLFDPIIAKPGAANPEVSSSNIALITDNSELCDIKDSQLIAHQIEAGDAAYSDIMPDNFVIQDVAKRKTRFRYICHGCGVKVYGKAHLKISCDTCDRSFEFGEHGSG